jgi:hypothetical protein
LVQTHWPVLLSHSCPDAQLAQAAPPVPHELFDWDANGTQLEPLQQPLRQKVPPQPHSPVLLSQSWPVAQAAQAAPPAPHFPADCEE